MSIEQDTISKSFISSESIKKCIISEDTIYIGEYNRRDHYVDVTIEYHLDSVVFHGYEVSVQRHIEGHEWSFHGYNVSVQRHIEGHELSFLRIDEDEYKNYCIKESDFYFKKNFFTRKTKKVLKNGSYKSKKLNEVFYIFKNINLKRS